MITPVKKQKRPSEPLVFNGFPRGLNTAVPSGMITNEELACCVDWKYNTRGQLESRDPITRYTNMGCTKTNLFGSSKYRTFSAWDTVSAGVAKNQIGIDDVANTASTLTDSDNAVSQSARENFVIANDSLAHSFYFALEIDTDSSRYPIVSLKFDNGSVLEETLIFDTTDGTYTELNSDGDYSVVVFDGWIFGKLTITNDSSGNTEAQCFVFPAASSDGSTIDVTEQGAAVFDWCLFCDGDSADADVATIGSAIIDGTNRVLTCDENSALYYLLNKTLTGIDTAEGEAQFLSYNNSALVLDGSYVKYLDDLTGLKIAYDTSEKFFDEYSTAVSANISITTAGVGCTVTTPSWDAGYTIPPTTVTAKVIDTSTSGAGTIEASFWDVTGSAEVAATNYLLTIPDTLDYVDIPKSDILVYLTERFGQPHIAELKEIRHSLTMMNNHLREITEINESEGEDY